jgi:hypothetical protein
METGNWLLVFRNWFLVIGFLVISHLFFPGDQ